LASFGVIFIWWAFSAALAFLAWPLSYRLFRWLPDRGLAFSRLVGWLFTGYVAWILGFAFNGVLTSVLAWLVLGLLSWWLYARAKGEHGAFLKANSGLVFLYELVFFALFFVWSMVRMKHPNIEGQEKFMDFAFFNSILRDSRLPPADPWLAAPHNYINYYYFGYFLNAAFARLTFIGPDFAYNLAVSNDFALCGLALLGLGYNLTRALWPGLVGLLCLQVFGNLHGALQVLGIGWNQPFSWWEPTRLIKDVTLNGHYLNRWWWSAGPDSLAQAGLGPDAARDGLISEFPAFSFLHGDLHPHFTALPLTLLALALGLNLVKDPRSEPLRLRKEPVSWEPWAVLALVLASVFMANTWDLPAYGLLVSLLALAQLHASGVLKRGNWLKAWFVPSILLLAGLLLAAAPFLAFFANPTRGFGFHGAHTGLHDTLIFWGVFLAVLLPYALLKPAALLEPQGTQGAAPASPKASPKSAPKPAAETRFCAQCGTRLRSGKAICGQCGAPAPSVQPSAETAEAATAAAEVPGFVAPWVRLFSDPKAAWRSPAVRFGAPLLVLVWAVGFILWPTVAVFGALASLSLLALLARAGEREGAFVAVLTLVGSLLVLATECVYLRDVFEGNPSLTRMNTVFKFYFQAWVLFSAAVPYAIWWGLKRLRRTAPLLGVVWMLVLGVLGGAALVYPVQAVAFVWNDFDHSANFEPTMDGAAWFKRDYPADFEAVQKMRDSIPGQPIIAEAVGGAYTHYARVSAYTGFRSVLGWGNHESQWRPSGWPTQTENDVNELFTTKDPARARQLLDQYQVEYVFIGQLEREKYGDGVEKFSALLGPPVIDEGGARVYRVPR
jgi:uncharacterized membrane protein